MPEEVAVEVEVEVVAAVHGGGQERRPLLPRLCVVHKAGSLRPLVVS